MGELAFVLKSMLVSFVLVALMQMKVGTSTVESHAQVWLQSSSISLYLQKVATGAALFLQNSSKAASDLIAKTFNGVSSENRASRLNIEFKRNQAVTEEEQSKKKNSQFSE